MSMARPSPVEIYDDGHGFDNYPLLNSFDISDHSDFQRMALRKSSSKLRGSQVDDLEHGHCLSQLQRLLRDGQYVRDAVCCRHLDDFPNFWHVYLSHF